MKLKMRFRNARRRAMTVGLVACAFASVWAAPTELEELRRVDFGNALAINSALSPDESYLYAVRRGPNNNGTGGSLAIVDIDTLTIESTLAINTGAPLDEGFIGDVAVHPTGNLVYVGLTRAAGGITTAGNSRIDVINVSDPANPFRTGSLFGTAPNAGGFSGLAISASGDRLYAVDRLTARVRAYNTVTGAQLAAIPVGTRPIDLVLSSDGTTLYTATESPNVVYVIQTSTLTVVDTIPLSLSASPGHFLALTPDDSQLLVTATLDGRISLISIATEAQTLIPTSASVLHEIAITPDGKLALSNSPEALAAPNGVSALVVVDLEAGSPTLQQEVQVLPIGGLSTVGLSTSATLPGVTAYVSTRLNPNSVVELGSPFSGCDFEDAVGVDNENFATSNPGYKGLNWTQNGDTTTLSRWELDTDGSPFDSFGGGTKWVQGFAERVDQDGIPGGATAGPNRAKIGWDGTTPIEFGNIGLRTRFVSDASGAVDSNADGVDDRWLTQITLRFRDTTNAETLVTVDLKNAGDWITVTAGDVAAQCNVCNADLADVKAIFFEGDSGTTVNSVLRNDRFAIDNLNM